MENEILVELRKTNQLLVGLLSVYIQKDKVPEWQAKINQWLGSGGEFPSTPESPHTQVQQNP